MRSTDLIDDVTKMINKGPVMNLTAFFRFGMWLAFVSGLQSVCWAQTVVDSDFSRGDFAALGWKADGAWDVFAYPKEAANNPGRLARFAANKPNGTLTKSFDEI